MKDVVSKIEVHETKEYEKFKLINENRKVSDNNVLENIILENNKLHLNPIIVNKDFEVVDGQHRLQVAKKHNLKIYYIIDEEHENKDIRDLNISTRIWTLQDHMEYQIKIGNKNYYEIKKLTKICRFSLFNFLESFSVENSRANKIRHQFVKGDIKLKFKFNELEDFIYKFSDIQEKYKIYTKKTRISKNGQRAIFKFISHDLYDHQKFLSKIEFNPDGLVRALAMNDYLQVWQGLEEVYNFRNRNKVDFS